MFDGDDKITVERSRKRDASTDRLLLREAMSILARRLRVARIHVRRKLLAGETLETDAASFRVVP